MCGISGTLGFVPSTELKQKALQIMASRGPDDRHELNVGTNAWMGAVRLAFQDVEGGRQPIVCDSGRVVVSLNGEIYNYHELADDLSTKGWELNTNCDTEVVGYLYLEYGYTAFTMMKGMFAVAIYDSHDETLILATDFLSQKPLYYFKTHSGSVVYASDSRCLDVLSGGEARLYKNDGVQDLFLYKAIMQINEDSRSIKRLGPGQILRVDVKNSTVDATTYYDYSRWLCHDTRTEDREEVIVDNIESLLLSAVKKRVDDTKSQVAFLSGGVDSSLIVMMLRRLYPRTRIDTFTLCYQGINTSGKNLDRTLAKKVSALGKTEHHEIFCNPDEILYHIPEIINSFGCPFSAVPSMWYLTNKMRQYGKYTLSGDGADELFGSYYTHRSAANENVQTYADALYCLRKYLASFWPSGLLSETFLYKQFATYPDILGNLSEYPLNEPIKIQLITEALTVFPSTVLTYVDRLSMAHSIEARSPFLDSDLWEYVMSLSDSFRIRDGQTKYLLKKVAERYLPGDVVFRKKEGFVYPVGSYISSHRDTVSSSICKIPDELLEDVFTVPINTVVENLYRLVDEGVELSFKAAQALHTLYCIYIAASSRSAICE